MRPFDALVVDEAAKCLGKPYIWGANGDMCWVAKDKPPQSTVQFANCVEAYDCVGLVKMAIKRAGGPDLRWTHNAQTLYDKLPMKMTGEDETAFRLRFYGPSDKAVAHVSLELARDERLFLIQAAGGDQGTVTFAEAMRRHAFVMEGHTERADFLGVRSLVACQLLK